MFVIGEGFFDFAEHVLSALVPPCPTQGVEHAGEAGEVDFGFPVEGVIGVVELIEEAFGPAHLGSDADAGVGV